MNVLPCQGLHKRSSEETHHLALSTNYVARISSQSFSWTSIPGETRRTVLPPRHTSTCIEPLSTMDGGSKRPLESETPDGPKSLSRLISPPRSKKQKNVETIPSPFRLTWIQDLDEESNKDAVTLADLLGDPLISECWDFNYLHSITFLMNAFDRDIKPHVQVHVVHGFWKREDENRLALVVCGGRLCVCIGNINANCCVGTSRVLS